MIVHHEYHDYWKEKRISYQGFMLVIGNQSVKCFFFQLKGVERRHKELKKRAQRRGQTVNATLEELNLVRNEFATEMKSIESMKSTLSEPPPLSEDANDMAEYLQSLQVC